VASFAHANVPRGGVIGMARIESLLAARLFLTPQLVGDRLFFLSNLSGHLSLYAMDAGGSVPEPLLPPQIALQNPELIGGYVFWVYAKLGIILVMIDRDGRRALPADGDPHRRRHP